MSPTIAPAEYDELPELTELTEADLGRGVWMDPDVLAWYRAWALVRSRIEAMINLRDPLAVLAS